MDHLTIVKNLAQELPGAACIVDKMLRIVFANKAFCALLDIDESLFVHHFGVADSVKMDRLVPDAGMVLQAFHDRNPIRKSGVSNALVRHADTLFDVSAIPVLQDEKPAEDVVLLHFDRTAAQPQATCAPGTESTRLRRRTVELETELLRLSDNVESMSRQLKKREKEIHHIKAELANVYAEVNDELEMAKSVQASLLPRELPDVINLKTSAVYIPTDKVGGDLYDILITPTQKIAILIFDVSGHGVPAALIAAMAKMLFAHFIEKIESPAAIFTEVNRQLCDFIQTEHYLTAFLGILDPIRNRMVYSRAGHVRPIVYHASENRVSFLGSKGFFIGHAALRSIAEYTEDAVNLSPDDKILFYTDGLTEGTNENNELYGAKRLADAVMANGDRPLDDFLNAVLEDQTAFRNGRELRDDFTMLGIQAESPEWLLAESGFCREDGPSVLLVYSYRDIDSVCGVLLRAMDNSGFPDFDIKHTKICMFEILMNAIEHGNHRDHKKRTVVLYKITPEKAMISVLDEGDGFDYANLPDPLDPQNILKDHGRGVYIVRQYMDEVSFNARGNRIMAVKYPRGGKKDGIENIQL